MSTVVVTGGAGYIGSHTCVELHAAGYDVVVVDDLRNAQAEPLRRIERISGRAVEFLFSSPSPVYDPDHKPPFREDAPLRASNPYGATKLAVDPARALAELGWSAQLDLTQMCADAVRFQRQNSQGYPRD